MFLQSRTSILAISSGLVTMYSKTSLDFQFTLWPPIGTGYDFHSNNGGITTRTKGLVLIKGCPELCTNYAEISYNFKKPVIISPGSNTGKPGFFYINLSFSAYLSKSAYFSLAIASSIVF